MRRNASAAGAANIKQALYCRRHDVDIGMLRENSDSLG
jgi:hypothetical protein